MVVEATTSETNKIDEIGENTILFSHRLDFIYDDEPLGFEKDPHASIKRIKAQDPQEVDLGDVIIRKPTYISTKTNPSLKNLMIKLLKDFKDCFAWDYDEISGLSQYLVELTLLI